MSKDIIVDFDKLLLSEHGPSEAAKKFLGYFCRAYKSIVLTTKKPGLLTKWLIFYDLDHHVEKINLFDKNNGIYAVHFNAEDSVKIKKAF